MIRGYLFLLFLVLYACSPVGYRHYSGNGNPAISDIPTALVSAGNYRRPGNSNLKESKYFVAFHRGLLAMQQGNHGLGVTLFSGCIAAYDDDGNALFMRGVCHYSLGDYKKAVNDFLHAERCGFEKEKTRPRIAGLYVQLANTAHQNKQWSEAIGCYKAALRFAYDENIVKNTLHAYASLAATRRSEQRIITYLQAYNFMRRYRVKPSPEFHDLGYGLANAAREIRDKSLVLAAIPRLRYTLAYPQRHKEKAYLHNTLGTLYMLLGKDDLAREQFAAVIRHYPESKVYKESAQQYYALGKPVYKYHAKYTFLLGSKHEKIDTLILGATIVLPQSVDAQQSGIPEITLNGTVIPYSTKLDRYGARYAKLQLTGKVRKGTNVLEVQTVVKKTGRRVRESRVRKYTLADYQKNTTWYKQLTASMPVVRTDTAFIHGILDTLRREVKGNSVHQIVKTVYHYVIDRLTYKMYDNKNRPIKTIIERLAQLNTGVCEDYAVLTAALLRGLGIPATCYTGPMLDEKIGHAWPVFYLPDFTPVTIDTTWGDNPVFRDYYLYYATSLTVAEHTTYDSDVIPGGGSIAYSGDSRLKITPGNTATMLMKAGKSVKH